MGYSGVIFAMMESAKEIEKQRKINKLNTMKKEEIYVVIDSEEKRNRAIQILSDAGEIITNESVLLNEFYNVPMSLCFDLGWYCIKMKAHRQEITLNQLEQMLNPIKEVGMSLDALKLIAESWGFELVEKKREIKIGDFGKFWSDNNCYFVGFLQDVYKISETNKCVFQMKDYGTFCYFAYLTDEEKANIQENW
jgi:hypothetical protein